MTDLTSYVMSAIHHDAHSTMNEPNVNLSLTIEAADPNVAPGGAVVLLRRLPDDDSTYIFQNNFNRSIVGDRLC